MVFTERSCRFSRSRAESVGRGVGVWLLSGIRGAWSVSCIRWGLVGREIVVIARLVSLTDDRVGCDRGLEKSERPPGEPGGLGAVLFFDVLYVFELPRCRAGRRVFSCERFFMAQSWRESTPGRTAMPNANGRVG